MDSLVYNIYNLGHPGSKKYEKMCSHWRHCKKWPFDGHPPLSDTPARNSDWTQLLQATSSAGQRSASHWMVSLLCGRCRSLGRNGEPRDRRDMDWDELLINFCSRLWGSWLWFGDIIVGSELNHVFLHILVLPIVRTPWEVKLYVIN